MPQIKNNTLYILKKLYNFYLYTTLSITLDIYNYQKIRKLKRKINYSETRAHNSIPSFDKSRSQQKNSDGGGTFIKWFGRRAEHIKMENVY